MRSAVVALLAVAAVAPAQALAAPELHERTSGSAKTDGAARYWTPERIREAEPRPLRQATGSAAASPPVLSSRGETGSIPPSYPNSDPARLRPNGTFEVKNPEARPERMTGKVLAKDRSGNYSCSATVVNSSTEKVIFTAAHCVRTKRWGWAKKFTFIPAYDRGKTPFGKWEWDSLYLPRGWSGLKFDYAAVSLKKRNGKKIENKVGGAGLAWNYNRNSQYLAFGFPVNYFNGERMMGCFSGLKDVDGNNSPAPIGIGCRMASGASGGGWLRNDHLASVTSYGYSNDPNTLYGPYFTKRAKKFLRWVERH